MSNTPEKLIPALRQYRHNIGDDSFVTGLDYEITCEVVNHLQAELDRLVVDDSLEVDSDTKYIKADLVNDLIDAIENFQCSGGLSIVIKGSIKDIRGEQ